MNAGRIFTDRSAAEGAGRIARWLPAIGLLVLAHHGTTAWSAEPGTAPGPRHAAIVRAMTYLSTEVTSWNREHTCYSCHNNGDAIRALLVARQHGFQFDATEVAKTVNWLRKPDEWSRNGPDGEFNDRRLATLQFSAALGVAELKEESAHRPLQRAASMLARELPAQGGWPSKQIGTIGSPITLGPVLATVEVRNVLRQADEAVFAEDIRRLDSWLRATAPKSVLNAAAALWGLARDTHPEAAAARSRCLDVIRRGQSDRDGGWGAYVTSATEPFDTAIVVLALQAMGDRSHVELINDGSDFLVASQLADGSWPETTRPTGRESYAHRVSTTAWCLHALVMVNAN